MTTWIDIIEIIGIIVLIIVLAHFLTKYLVKSKKEAKTQIELKKKAEYKPAPENIAGFGIRAIAFIIDLAIYSTAMYFVSIAFGLQAMVLNAVIFLAGWCIYYTVLVAGLGNTAGKKLLNLKIVSATTKPLTITRTALKAFFLITIDWIILGAGFWVVLINKNKQGWHDSVSKTYVVKVKK